MIDLEFGLCMFLWLEPGRVEEVIWKGFRGFWGANLP